MKKKTRFIVITLLAAALLYVGGCEVLLRMGILENPHELAGLVKVDEHYRIMDSPYGDPKWKEPCGPYFTLQGGKDDDGYPALGFELEIPDSGWTPNVALSMSKLEVEVDNASERPSVRQRVDWKPGDPAPDSWRWEKRELWTVIRLSERDLRKAGCLKELVGRKLKAPAPPPPPFPEEAPEPEVLDFYRAPDGTQIAMERDGDHTYRSTDGREFVELPSGGTWVEGGKAKYMAATDPYAGDRELEGSISGDTLILDGKEYKKFMNAAKDILARPADPELPENPDSRPYVFHGIPNRRGPQFLGATSYADGGEFIYLSTKKYDGGYASLRIFVGDRIGPPTWSSDLIELPILETTSWCSGARYEVETPKGTLKVDTCGHEEPTWDGRRLTIMDPSLFNIKEEKDRAVIKPAAPAK